MTKPFCTFPHTKLIECSEKWVYYKKFKDVSLYLYESEYKYPSKIFFTFCDFKSSIVKHWELTRTDEKKYIEFVTEENSCFCFEIIKKEEK